jgi:anthranilate 1,2-dioxygenase small subunit
MPRIQARDDGDWSVLSGYALYQTDQDGTSQLFSVGSYVDRIRIDPGAARFIERRVIVDTFAIQNMLSTPI